MGLVPPALHGALRPISVIIQVTRHCNYRCQFCIVNELVTDADGSQAISLAEFSARPSRGRSSPGASSSA
ncbi:MAG TPA: hypothetical protein VFF73_28965 [Planctomycetota bacterium]|nr:hypothetical protein [Planctomycetota bacterium]